MTHYKINIQTFTPKVTFLRTFKVAGHMVDSGEDLKTLNSDILNLQRDDDMFFFSFFFV